MVVEKLWLVVVADGKIMAGRGWSHDLVMSISGRGWWRQNYGWSWVVVIGRGWPHDLVMPIIYSRSIC